MLEMFPDMSLYIFKVFPWIEYFQPRVCTWLKLTEKSLSKNNYSELAVKQQAFQVDPTAVHPGSISIQHFC